jgi:hypothetical protein
VGKVVFADDLVCRSGLLEIPEGDIGDRDATPDNAWLASPHARRLRDVLLVRGLIFAPGSSGSRLIVWNDLCLHS